MGSRSGVLGMCIWVCGVCEGEDMEGCVLVVFLKESVDIEVVYLG